ncbi:MAG TPA: PQQ-binding-like beta-propeller repeat protein [Thermoanaerobaculia bacterium]|nr:PQQ-binding-like beta-propeller repeat protein [Thermoanaerobaculia bacterium]
MRRVALGLAAGLLGAACAIAESAGGAGNADWPQWAGPSRNATASAGGLFQGPVELREAWRKPAREGISALTVAAGRLFSLGTEAGFDVAFALDAKTGKELWQVRLGPANANMEFAVTSTPASDGKRVYVLGGACVLRALEAETGKEVWNHDLKAEFNPGPMANGCWTSPLLDGPLLVVQVNGEPDKLVMAFDAATGAVKWAAKGTIRAVRTSPAVADIGGVRQVVVHEGNKEQQGGLYGLRLTDGAQLWSLRFDPVQSFSFDTPLAFDGDRVAAVAWSEVRTVQVKKTGDAWKAELLWSARDIRADNQPFTSHVVAHEGYLYGLGGDLLVCLEAATGKKIWQEKVYTGSLILVDGHLVVLAQGSGLVRVVAATPEGYREKLRKQVFTPGALSDVPPSFADGRLYLRNAEDLVAFEVVKAAPR